MASSNYWLDIGGNYMKEKLMKSRDATKAYWQSLSKRQKRIFIGSGAFIILLIIALTFLSLNKSYVPLYNDLSVQEVSQIKEELEARDVPFDIKEIGRAHV